MFQQVSVPEDLAIFWFVSKIGWMLLHVFFMRSAEKAPYLSHVLSVKHSVKAMESAQEMNLNECEW